MAEGKDRCVLQVRFDVMAYSDVFQCIETWRRQRLKSYVVLANPHSVYLAERHPEMKAALGQAGLILPDGIGVIVAARLLGYRAVARVTGPMLVLHLCDWGRSRGYRHFFYGGRQGVAARLAFNLMRLYPGLQVAGWYSPPFRMLGAKEEPEVIHRINQTKPDIVWVGLGAPKQEVWMASHLRDIHCTAMIGVGAAFDFHSGRIPWAPRWMRDLGLEWLHRLANDPMRVWPKAIDGAKLVFSAAAERFWQSKQLRWAPSSDEQPRVTVHRTDSA